MGNGNCKTAHWRTLPKDFGWTLEYRDQIIENIKEKIPKRTSVTPCLLLIGPVSSGKSSLVNTFHSAASDEIEVKANTGSQSDSVTEKFTRYDAPGKLLEKYRICDTMGILPSGNKGIHPDDVIYALNGNIGQEYEFKEHEPISKEDSHFVKEPDAELKSHCLVIVLDINMIEVLSPEFTSKVREAIKKSRHISITPALILTKADKLCQNVKSDVRNVFTCQHVRKIVDISNEKFGITKQFIFPVINYCDQVAHDSQTFYMNIISLLALDRLLHSASSYLEGAGFKDATNKDSKTQY